MQELNMFWMGRSIASVQQCIDSFARFHSVKMWCYTSQDYVNCEIKNANEILPSEDLHENLFHKTSISDWFRINLTHQLGGWYSDSDNYCLSELDFPEANIFTFFKGETGDLNNSIFKCEAGSQILKAAIDNYKFNKDAPAYLYFGNLCKDKEATYLHSDILHYRHENLATLDLNRTKVIHLFQSSNEARNLDLIELIKTKINGCS